MNPAQVEVLARVRAQLGDDAAHELKAGWERDGVGKADELPPAAGDIGQLAAWRLGRNPYRRGIAEARLAKLGYELRLERRVTDEDARLRRLEDDQATAARLYPGARKLDTERTTEAEGRT